MRQVFRPVPVALHIAICIAMTLFICNEKVRAEQDHSVKSALAAFRLADPDLIIEPAATEPDVVSPVAVAWDEDQRMYVAEMRDYPSGPAGQGTIRMLEDEDSDGRYEKSVIFADKLAFPSSCLPWRGGLLVTAAPDILYLKDTDGDGRADERHVVLTGFTQGDQQLQVNGLMFGIDGWVYAANGRLGGAIRRPSDPKERAVSIAKNDIRFQPDTGEFETVAGPSQFGLARDDWGNRFLSWNTIPVRQVVIEDRYLAGSPATRGESGIGAMIPADDAGQVYSIAPAQRRYNRESASFFNAVCGPVIYRAGFLRGYQGDAFFCESLSSLVQHRRLTPDGCGITASRVEEGREFLASTDSWFRPVNLATGPDGLYVVDFSRQEVEHPDYIPEVLRKELDFRAGENLGRIWRIQPKQASSQHKRVKLSALPSAELFGHLADSNGWLRDQVQRLLIERADATSVAPLNQIAMNGSRPEARLAALWALQIMDDWTAQPQQFVDEQTLRKCLQDSSPAVRRGALQVLESHLPGDHSWRDEILKLASDSNDPVRLQAALIARKLDKEARYAVLKGVARAGASDRWIRLAILSSLGDDTWEFLASMLSEPSPGSTVSSTGAAGETELLCDLARAVGASAKPEAITAFFRQFAVNGASEERSMAILAGFVTGYETRGASFPDLLTGSVSGGGTADTRIHDAVKRIITRAAVLAALDSASLSERLRAARVLVLASQEKSFAVWSELLTAGQPDELRAAAARGLGRTADGEAVEKLLERWDGIPTSARRTLLVELSRRKEHAGRLLDAAEAGRISVIELRAAAGEVFAAHTDSALKARATSVFKTAGGDRAKLIERYRPALTRSGDVRSGAQRFAENCLACHKIMGLGQTVGPDLSGIAGRTKEKLLSDILDPGAEIVPDLMNYIVTTKSGDVYSGLLAQDTPVAVTLRQAQGLETSIPRGDIAELRAGNASLMPEGLEEVLDVQAMADLLEFLHRSSRELLESAASSSASSPPRQ